MGMKGGIDIFEIPVPDKEGTADELLFRWCGKEFDGPFKIVLVDGLLDGISCTDPDRCIGVVPFCVSRGSFLRSPVAP